VSLGLSSTPEAKPGCRPKWPGHGRDAGEERLNGAIDGLPDPVQMVYNRCCAAGRRLAKRTRVFYPNLITAEE